MTWLLSLLLRNATFRLYTSPAPVGRHLGGHDDPFLPNLYIILDVRAGSRIILLGYFQTT